MCVEGGGGNCIKGEREVYIYICTQRKRGKHLPKERKSMCT